MANFCGKCGARLDPVSGKCPNCENNDVDPKQGKAKKTKGRRVVLKLLLFIFVVSVIVIGIMAVFVKFDIIKKQDVKDLLGVKEKRTVENYQEETETETETTEEDVSKSYEVPSEDADEYYRNSAKILSEENASDSKTVSSEKGIRDNMKQRGFTQNPITYEYSMNGQYLDSSEALENSNEKHPMYKTFYTTENGDLWTIIEVNGTVVANPFFYNEQSKHPVQLIISEKDSVVSYDSAKNKFYETIPNNLELVVKKVETINAETLDKLTIEEIDNL